MAQFTRETVHYLTSLTRIQCTEEEEEALLADLEKIIHYVELLEQVDTENVEPLVFVVESQHDSMRDDLVEETLPREVYLSNAPQHVGGMVRVPPVLKPA